MQPEILSTRTYKYVSSILSPELFRLCIFRIDVLSFLVVRGSVVGCKASGAELVIDSVLGILLRKLCPVLRLAMHLHV